MAGAAVVTLVVGCGNSAAPPQARPGQPVWVEPQCPKRDPDQRVVTPLGTETRGGIPDDFTAQWVLRCHEGGRAERTEAKVAELVDLLRRPSDPRTDGTCPAHFIPPPYVVLVNAENKAVLPAVPTDDCGTPRLEVREFIDSLTYRPA
jgi:hypothetical protein